MSILHKWHFFRSGGFDQVHLNSSADLKSLGELDPKLWAALSCPTDHLEFDAKTLEFIDTDKDGHIRVPEIIAAVNWATSLLKNPEDMIRGSNSLPLNAINDDTAEGAILLASAKEILLNIGKGEEPAITVEDTADLNKIFASTKYNGDGIIPSSAASEPNTQTVIEEIILCVGSEEDRSGLPGISEEKVKQFYLESNAFSEWWREAEKDSINILLLGDETGAAQAAFDRVKVKIDDYFTRSKLAEFDQRASDPLNPALTEYEALTSKNLSADSEEVAAFPLAKVEAKKPLPLDNGINPAWIEALAEFKKKVVTPLLGNKDNLSHGDWQELCNKFAAYQAWLKAKRGAAVEPLGIKRVRAILTGGYHDKILQLIQNDKSHSGTADAINSVEKLIRFHCHLFQLLDNFVSFHDFYTAQNKAIFQAGSLYLDGRSCDFCLHVTDINKHSSMANLSGTYLAYCECQRRGDDSKKMNIAAAFTNGDADNLMVGRNGIFYDRKGQDWDATIVKIIEHPISVRQAFWYPYKRIGKMIGEQIEKMVSAREKAVQDQAASGIANTAQTGEAGKTPPAPFDVGKFAGIFAAIGLAIGAIGTAIASVVTGFISLVWWQMPLAILGLILLISGPSVILAFLKLRKRNLAPLLDGNGWAVNTRAIINIPFGASLTKMASLPPGAQRSLVDPYAEKERPWKLYLFIILLLSSILLYLWTSDHFNPGTREETQKQLSDKKSETITEDKAKLDNPGSENKIPGAPQSVNSLQSDTKVSTDQQSGSSSATIVPIPKPTSH
ncbi:hypothetical protein [Nitrosomonas ureae]|uniref:EF-hand domain-containing protein n=1 Tax=Nitrosomonas ureae TaxID=44577 RepID=A0A286A4E8_9PROT|nr:hypothetical protein [Nitrosomonas ureae]SOD16786.1 hypothetical protein SAMN06297164_0752 [Nitrosomonas ureae]